MPISQAVFEIVPVGEKNAVSGRLFWKQLGMCSAESIKHKLNQLAAEGLIERKRIFDGSRETSCISDRVSENARSRVIAPADAKPGVHVP